MHITQRGDIMPRLKLLKYKKSRRTLASCKVHHNSVFSYIKRARSNITGFDPQVKYYGKTHDIKYIKMFGKRKLSIPELCDLNDAYDLRTESYRLGKHVTPMSSLYKYRSTCVYH
jgi:hypothetical protein